MRVDIFCTALARISIQPMLDAVQQRAPPRAINHLLQVFAVGEKEREQSAQIRRVPVPVDITFGKADIARFQRALKYAPIIQAQSRAHALRRIRLAAARGWKAAVATVRPFNV